jgi:hypothetical protein
MPTKVSVGPAGFGRRTHTVSTRASRQNMSSPGAFWHRHGSSYVVLKDRVVNGKKDILRLRKFLARVCRLKGWK